jgi:hypothetical protein
VIFESACITSSLLLEDFGLNTYWRTAYSEAAAAQALSEAV